MGFFGAGVLYVAMMLGTRQAAVRGWLLLSAACSLCAVPGTASTAAADQKLIVVSRADSVPGRSFAIVGRVLQKALTSSLTESNQGFEERAGQRLVGKARELGADAVLGMHGLPMDPETYPQWVSGIAVRFVEPGASAPSKRMPFIVAVLPIQTPDSLVKSAKRRSRLADGFRDAARAKLETRGYYAATDQPAAPDSTQLAAMSDSTWDATFGAWTERVLCIRPGASRASSLVIQKKQQHRGRGLDLRALRGEGCLEKRGHGKRAQRESQPFAIAVRRLRDRRGRGREVAHERDFARAGEHPRRGGVTSRCRRSGQALTRFS